MEANVQQNEWEGLFESFLDLTEFSLEYHKDTREWGLYDRQGANLGDIQSDRFEHAGQIFDRMGVYINDYIFEDLKEEAEAYHVELPSQEYMMNKYTVLGDEIRIFDTDCTAFWIALRAEIGREHPFVKDHEFAFNICEMIRYHWAEINLNNICHEEV